MGMVRIYGMYDHAPVDSFLHVIRPTLKWGNGYLKMIGFDERLQMHEFEYTRTTIFDLSLGDETSDEEFDEQVAMAIKVWEEAIEPAGLGPSLLTYGGSSVEEV